MKVNLDLNLFLAIKMLLMIYYRIESFLAATSPRNFIITMMIYYRIERKLIKNQVYLEWEFRMIYYRIERH